MGKHPIRCGFRCPLRIALTLGQVAHATSGAKSGGEGVCGHSGQNGQNYPKVVLPKIVSPYHKRKEPRAFAWMRSEALLPFCNKGGGSRHNGNIFNTSILEAHYLWEKVHISAILACTYLWVIGEQKCE